MDTETKKTITDLWIEADAIQNACNLSGVLHSWARAQILIRDACKPSERYETHPINVMFMSKVASLMRVDCDCIGGVSQGGKDLAWDAFAKAAIAKKGGE
jgi:hypothetical protein